MEIQLLIDGQRYVLHHTQHTLGLGCKAGCASSESMGRSRGFNEASAEYENMQKSASGASDDEAYKFVMGGRKHNLRTTCGISENNHAGPFGRVSMP